MKLKHHINLALALLLLAVSNMDANEIFPDTINPSKSEISGEYYDWTKTMAPETPWRHDYNKTLVTKIFLCSRDGQGDVDRVYLKFEEVLEVLRKMDQITLGLPKIVYLVGWQYNGHDSKYPAWGEVNRHLKREKDQTAHESLKWLMKEAKKYHTTISLHLNMIDAFEDSPLWDLYFSKDIIAKDSQGIPIKGEVFAGMQSFQLSYAREWELGLAQKRIDGLLDMLPELKDAGTIHIDAFHSMRPSGVGEPISPYLDYSMEDEIETQRKIFRYWQLKGIDVTSEGGMYWLRQDPFIGLQAMAWHFNLKNFIQEDWLHKPDDFSSLPAIFSAFTPMQSEAEIKTDPENLTGLLEQFCMNVVPWYYKRNPDVETDGDVIISKKLVVCPVLWNEKAVLVYGKKRYFAGKKIELPSSWGDIQEVQVYELTLEGLEWHSSLLVHENVVKLDVRKDLPVILLPY